MPKPTKGPRLGGGPAHERLMLANLAAALFTHKSIKTTETKAKRLRPRGRAPDHVRQARRPARPSSRARRRSATRPSCTSCSPRSRRSSPSARAATPASPSSASARATTPRWLQIELVLEPVSPKKAVVKEAEKAAETAAPVAEAPEAETTEAPVTEAETAGAESAEAPAAAEAESADSTEAPAEEKIRGQVILIRRR